MNQALPFSPQQADYTFFRQDPNVSQEVQLSIPDFPQRMAGNRDALERYSRVAIQNGHQRNPLRLFLFNQMSANNWQNHDWIALVKNLGNLLDFLIYDQQKPGTQQLVSEAVEMTIKLMMLRAVEQYPSLLNYIDQNLYQELGNVKVTRDQVRQLMNEAEMRRGQGGMFQQNNQNAQLMNFNSNWSAGMQQQPMHQQQTPHQLGGGTSGRISINDLAPAQNHQPKTQPIQTGSGMFESWESSPTHRQPVVGGGNTEFRGFFAETEEVRLTPSWEEPASSAPQQQAEPVEDYRDQIIRKYGAMFPMMEIAGKAYPLVYDRFRYQLNENGVLMKQSDHVIGQMEASEPRPTGGVIPVYVPIDRTAPENPVNTRKSFLKAEEADGGLIVLPDTIIGLEIDTAAGLVNMRTNAYVEKKVVEFGLMAVDAVFVPDRDKFFTDFAGLLIDTPETDITKLMELVVDSGNEADAIYRKLNRRVTTAINRILNENLGLVATVDDGARDWIDLPSWLNKKKGAQHMAALNDCIISVVNAACCVASGSLDESVREYNFAKLHINQSSGLIYDRKEYNVRAMTPDELEVHDTEVQAASVAAGLTNDSYIQLIYSDYVSLLPLEFEHLGIDLADGNEVTVVHESAHPELSVYLKAFYRRAGGDANRFDNIYLTTIDGAVMRVVRLALADDTVLGLVRVF